MFFSCFIDLADGGFCGNGVVEADEDCDCGVSEGDADTAGFIASCEAADSCCSTRCTLKPGKQCSPLKGECCTDDGTCQLKGQ